MAEEKAQVPFGEMIALWQKMMWEGFEMMLKGPPFAAGLGKAFGRSTVLQEELQEKWRRSVDETIQRLFARQEEGQKDFQAWTKEVENRLSDLQRFWEEGTRRWTEGLTEEVALGQISHRSLEELGKAVSDISESVFRQGPATPEAKENPRPSQRQVKGPPEK